MFRAVFWTALFLGLLSLLTDGAAVQAGAVYYKYTDKKGTVHFVQEPGQIPPAFRKAAKKINMPDRPEGRGTAGQSKLTEMKDEAARLLSRVEGQKLAEGQLHKGRELLASFLRDQKYIVAGYAAGGLVLFIILSMVMKRFVGKFMFRILMRVGLIVVLMAGGYLFYMSWLSRNVLSVDPQAAGSGGPGAQKGEARLLTPAEIMQRTRAAASQMDARTRKQEQALKELEKD